MLLCEGRRRVIWYIERYQAVVVENVLDDIKGGGVGNRKCCFTYQPIQINILTSNCMKQT